MSGQMWGFGSPNVAETETAPAAKPNTPGAPARPSRRDLLKQTGVLGAAAVASTVGGCHLVESSAEASTGRRLSMVLDLRRCTGCRSCTVACKAEHNVRLGGFRSWVNSAEKGTFPNVKRFFLPRLCNHCKASTCSMVCPTRATYERADGVVMIDKEKCIGCRYCINACPYGSRYMNWQEDGTGDLARTRGTVDKCDFCVHRIDRGLVPACVQTCPSGARIFGDLNDPDSEVAKLVRTQPVQTLFPAQGTKPYVFHIALDESVVDGAIEGGR